MEKPLVGIVMGSDSDLPTLGETAELLEKLGIPYEMTISSAHRSSQKTSAYARTAAERGLEVIIAAAGGAAHLPGAIAAETTLPVIGIPLATESLGGVDSLYSMVQMPRGVPVATMAIGKAGAANAALFAAGILALSHPKIKENLKGYRQGLSHQVELKAQRLDQLGWGEYLKQEGKKPKK